MAVGGNIAVTDAAGPVIQNEAATATNPTFVPNNADPDTGIGWVSADALSLVAGGTGTATVTTSGVYIGAGSAEGTFKVYMDDTDVDPVTIEQDGTGDAAIEFLITGVSNFTLGIDNSDSDKFKISRGGDVGTNPDFTIDSSGKVGIGTVNVPSNKNTVAPILNVSGSGVAGSAQITRHTAVGGGGALLHLAGTRGSDVNSYTILQDDDGIGTIAFQAADGNEFATAAQIVANVDGTPGDNDMPGRLSFGTTADGASSPTERIRITSAGKVGIGTSSPAQKLTIDTGFTQHTNGYGLIWGGDAYIKGQGDSSQYLLFNAGGSGSQQFQIGGTEKIRVDTAGLKIGDGGSLVVGRSASPVSMGGSAATLQSVGTAEADSTIAVGRWSADANAARFIGFKSRNAGVGSTTIVADDDNLLDIVAYADDAAADYFESPAAMIRFSVDGTPGTNDMPGRITFHTSADGGEALTERMRLDSAGHLTSSSQPAFYATCAALANKTGNGTTTYIVGSAGYTWTEAEDNNADFDGAGLFTAPVDGFYHLSGTMGFSGLNGATSGVGYLIVSNGNISILHNPTNISNVSVNYNLNISQVVYMDANDTAQMAMYINGAGSDVCDLDSAQFSGYLLG